ncbi:MAG TPA: hypothetical protein VF773_09955 [Verrucomicrobiae bacterium]
MFSCTLGLFGSTAGQWQTRKPRAVHPSKICSVHQRRMEYRPVHLMYDPAEEGRFSNRFGASYTNMRVRFAREPLTVAETNKLVCVECDYLLTEFARTNVARQEGTTNAHE